MRDVAWSVWEPVATKFLHALGAIHAAGLVHGDIKPQNVLVTSAGNPVIIDFGTARSTEDAKKTRLTTVAMTPGYCPPELAVRDRAREMGPWSDLYSWALTVMGLVIRHRGIDGSPPDAAARKALAEHGHSDAGMGAETVTALRAAGVPQAWMEVLMACVALDPAARPRSSEELFAHLEAAKRHPPAVVPSSPPAAPPAPPAPPQVQPVAVPSSAKWAAWGIVLFMLACCAVGVVILVKTIQSLAAVYPRENLPSLGRPEPPEPPEPPEVILNETRVLTEGSYSGRSFGVSGISRVSISVKAKPEPVDFFLLNEENWVKFQAAFDAGRSGGFSYLAKLSSENVLAKEMAADVGPGTWHLIVQRPRDSAFGGDDTAATILITKQVIVR
ncbi:MAG: phosphotransferase [Deltaproteobacteria bacterium]|nr:phosphotransferase [Deltaproteobacteria bacterium]